MVFTRPKQLIMLKISPRNPIRKMPIFADSLTRPFQVRVAKDMADLIQCFRLKGFGKGDWKV